VSGQEEKRGKGGAPALRGAMVDTDFVKVHINTTHWLLTLACNCQSCEVTSSKSITNSSTLFTVSAKITYIKLPATQCPLL